jgi:two-component system cell cycle sensor histidine kinase/response regulator CckA
MNSLPFKVLLVEDDEDDVVLVKNLLGEVSSSKFEIEWAATYSAALDSMDHGHYDVCLLDYRLGDHDGLELLSEVRSKGCKCPIIFLTGQGDYGVDFEAMRGGAADYLVKGEISASLLERSIRYALERARSEEALKGSEKRYRLFVENANDAIFIIQEESMAFPNRRARELCEQLGLKPDHVPFTEYIHPADRALIMERHKRRLRGDNVPNNYRFRIVSKEGKEWWVEINAIVISWEDKPATLNFLRDVTLQKRLESQLQQAQRMEAIGALAGGLAHDFNNLLMGIEGNITLMQMETDPDHPHYELLKNIEQSVKSGASLTRQLLHFAKGGRYEVRPTDLNELLKTSSEMFGRTKKQIRIKRALQKKIWPVEVDKAEIEQVLINLYVNAWQAMPGGGDLYLKTANVTLEKEYAEPFRVEPGRYVRISVRDTGEGMDEKTRQRIFEPFFTTKEQGKGTGLGLASSYGIVKNHRGFIEVYSETGVGTTFNIYLPASTKKVVKLSERPEPPLKGKGTLLIVDDEKSVLEVTSKMLKKLGFQTLLAGSGEEALEALKANRGRIDVVILDMILPDLSGSEIYERMKEVYPRVRILLSSGYSVNEEISGLIARGADGFIQKPFSIAHLVDTIREILENPKKSRPQ